MRPVLKVVLAIWAGWLMTADASPLPATPLQLDTALRAAVAQHPSVTARRSERTAAAMRLDMAQRQRYPGLAAQSGTDANGARNTTLRVSQPLWTGGRITGEIDVAQAAIKQAEAGVAQAQQDIMLRVVDAFTELGRVQARQQAAQSNVEEHLRLADMIRRRVDSEVSPTSDRIQASARLSQAKAELNLLESQAQKARSALAQTTGMPVTDIVLPAQRDLQDRSLDGLITAALDFSPALRRLEHEYEAATADITVRRSAALPQVQMRLDHNRTKIGSNTQMYVALDVQTGAGFSVQASVREAEAKRDAIRSQFEATRRNTIDNVSADWAELRAQNKQSLNLNAQVVSTTAVFDSFVRQYAVNRKGWHDVLNAQREVAQARFQLADADWGALRSALRLQIITGFLNAEHIAQTPSTEAPTTAAVHAQAVTQTTVAEPAVLSPVPSSRTAPAVQATKASGATRTAQAPKASRPSSAQQQETALISTVNNTPLPLNQAMAVSPERKSEPWTVFNNAPVAR